MNLCDIVNSCMSKKSTIRKFREVEIYRALTKLIIYSGETRIASVFYQMWDSMHDRIKSAEKLWLPIEEQKRNEREDVRLTFFHWMCSLKCIDVYLLNYTLA